MLLAEQPDGVEHGLVAARLAERARKLRFEPLFVGQRAEKARIDQRIDEMRILRQNIGKPRRGAEDQRDKADQFRILPQQREKAAAGAQAGKKAVERGKTPRPDFRHARIDR